MAELAEKKNFSQTIKKKKTPKQNVCAVLMKFTINKYIYSQYDNIGWNDVFHQEKKVTSMSFRKGKAR